ncbi:MAG: thio(seleno)oxazole modification radical SAM maturase SbtM, partial [Victivallales bacterium]
VNGSTDQVLAESIPDLLEEKKREFKLPDYINDLARFELACFKTACSEDNIPLYTTTYKLNPTLKLLKTSWRIIPWVEGEKDVVEKGVSWVIVWRDAKTGETLYQEAGKDILMALKIAGENLSPDKYENEFKIKPGKILSILAFAASNGIITGPMPLMTRGFAPDAEEADALASKTFHSAYTFTLTWNIPDKSSHANDITRCKTDALASAGKILDDLAAFSANGNFRVHVSFNGHNPFSNHSFVDIYRMAAAHDFLLSINAGPTSLKNLEEILSIQKPEYYQISLQGLDTPAEKAALSKKIAFLELLKSVDIPSAVVICITKDNISNIIPLASSLKDKAVSFSFSRLPQTWDPISEPPLPAKDEFQIFIGNYVSMSLENTFMGYKDNLINIELTRRGLKPFDGCCGVGCGAAFCRMAIHHDGEIHACPSFPSPIGNIFRQGFRDIYKSEIARKYRRGPESCASCRLRPSCGGCMSMTARMGFDKFKNSDPYCFIDK